MAYLPNPPDLGAPNRSVGAACLAPSHSPPGPKLLPALPPLLPSLHARKSMESRASPGHADDPCASPEHNLDSWEPLLQYWPESSILEHNGVMWKEGHAAKGGSEAIEVGVDGQGSAAGAAHISGDATLSNQGGDILGQGRYPPVAYPGTSIETAGSGQYQVST